MTEIYASKWNKISLSSWWPYVALPIVLYTKHVGGTICSILEAISLMLCLLRTRLVSRITARRIRIVMREVCVSGLRICFSFWACAILGIVVVIRVRLRPDLIFGLRHKFCVPHRTVADSECVIYSAGRTKSFFKFRLRLGHSNLCLSILLSCNKIVILISSEYSLLFPGQSRLTIYNSIHVLIVFCWPRKRSLASCVACARRWVLSLGTVFGYLSSTVRFLD